VLDLLPGDLEDVSVFELLDELGLVSIDSLLATLGLSEGEFLERLGLEGLLVGAGVDDLLGLVNLCLDTDAAATDGTLPGGGGGGGHSTNLLLLSEAGAHGADGA